MPKKVIIISLISMTLAGFWLHYYSDKAVIKRELSILAMAISKSQQENPIEMSLNLGDIKKRLIDPCQVVIPEKNFNQSLTYDLIMRYLIYYRQLYLTIDLTFTNVVINLPEKKKAVVQITVRLLRQHKEKIAVQEELYPGQFILKKEDKKWRIQEVTLPLLLIE